MQRSLTLLPTALLIALSLGATTPSQNDEVAQRLKDLVASPPITQEQLDSLSDRLVYLNNLNDDRSQTTCHEIALLKAEIAHGCLKGGRSIHITSLLDDASSCSPHHELYDFILGGIAYNTGQFSASVDRYRQALESLSIQDTASVMIQINLSAALHGAGRHAEAVDSLIAMLDADHWKAAPALKDAEYIAQITINAAAILISEMRDQEALHLLETLENKNTSEYWKVIKLSNQYIAQSNLAQFGACDTLWLKTIQNVPFADLPLLLFQETLGSWLALDAYDYCEQLMENSSITNRLLESDAPLLAALLDPQITNSVRRQRWELLQAANLQERERLERLVSAQEKTGSPSKTFTSVLEKLGLQKRKTMAWQWISLLATLALFTYVLTRRYYKQQAEQKIEAAVQNAERVRKQIPANSKLKIIRDDIRKIHLGLTKGHQIGEALLSLQKVEILHKESAEGISAKDLGALAGADTLSEIEMTVLQMTMEGITTKEIAHQLNVSSGYVYNSRSAIRKKLGIPKELSITLWVKRSQS